MTRRPLTHRRLRAIEGMLPDVLSRLARHLRVGQGLSMALFSITHELQEPFRGEIERCLSSHRQGRALADALYDLVERIPLPDLELLVAAIEIQHESGGNLAQVVDALATTVKRRDVMRRELRSYTAEARLSALILTGLPMIVGAVLLIFRYPEFRHLMTLPWGTELIAGAFAGLMLGSWLVHQSFSRLDQAL